MTYSSKPPKDYSKLRTQPELIRQEYERKANQALKETVAKEQAHFQQQVDEYKEYASKEIEKAWGEAEHWKLQTQIIYALMEQSEKEIKREREVFRGEVEVLKRRIERLEADKRNRTKMKKVTSRE